MSYSFTVRAPTKSQAEALIAAELAKVIEQQPIHELDRAQVQAAVHAFVELLPDEKAKDVQVRMHGSVSAWTSPTNEQTVTSISFGFHASYLPHVT